MKGLAKHQIDRSRVQRHVTLLIGLFFISGLLFLGLADFNVPNSGGTAGVVQGSDKALAENPVEMAGVGWTGYVPSWLLNLLGYNGSQVA